jgi:hypothetical protein
VFPNASRMTSSIDAANSLGMTEPFTPAGAVSNLNREQEPREPMGAAGENFGQCGTTGAARMKTSGVSE